MEHSFLQEFLHNVSHNLFKPLLLFFYMGFLVPILKVPFEFPKVVYQGLTIYLLIAIGWHGGEELASLSSGELRQAVGFMALGFVTNFFIGILAYGVLRTITKLRRVDAATVAAYYGSDSAGTFVTCVGVLTAASIAYAKYMPVMLAVMEIPGCLVGLYLVSRMRQTGMDRWGNMPDEPGYMKAPPSSAPALSHGHGHDDEEGGHDGHGSHEERDSHGGVAVAKQTHRATAVVEPQVAHVAAKKSSSVFSPKILHEIFLNPGLYLLFGGILIGFVGRLQGAKVTDADDPLFLTLFQGMLCLFLLEMGMTACQRLRDLKTAGIPFIAYGVIAPNVFAFIGITVAHVYSHVLGEPFDTGTYVLFSVLCAAASYIAVPAIQRLAIPEASPTLPLAASLGLTFSYNVTIGIPLYIEIAKAVTKAWPVIEHATQQATGA